MGFMNLLKSAKNIQARIVNLSLASIIGFSGLFSAVPFLFPQSASASGPTVYVDSSWSAAAPGSDPDGAGPATNFGTDAFSSIQSAVFAAASGDVVSVAAGLDTETGQIIINKNLSIVGAGMGATTINTSSDTGNTGDSKGWFLVNSGITFDVSELTLDGAGHKVYQAIRYNGSGTINHVSFTNIAYEQSGPQYNGAGVRIGASSNVNVTNSTFSGMGRVGLLAEGGAGTFSGNIYTGKGAGNWLDYALDIEFGSHITVSSNQISQNRGVATSDGSTSAAIAVWDDAGTQAIINNNAFTDNTAGVAVAVASGTTDPIVTIGSGNIFSGNDFGVDIQNAGATGSPSVSITGSTFSGNITGINVPSGMAAVNISVHNSVFSANTSHGVNSGGSGTLSATNNYWGSAGPNFSALISGAGAVDHSPWWGANYVGSDHSSAWTWATDSSIQTAIDTATAGDTVDILSGTYNESLLLSKSLSLLGVGATKPVITGFAPANYIFKVNATNGVTLSNLEINGGGSIVNSNTFDYGILAFNSGTNANPITATNLTIKNIWHTNDATLGTSGAPVMAFSNTGAPSYIEVNNTEISSFAKNGVKLIKSNGAVRNSEIVGDNVDGTNRVQNLITLWAGSTATIDSNILRNALTSPGVIPTWTSPAILVTGYNAGVAESASHATITNNQIYNDDSGIVITSFYTGGAIDGTDLSSATITGNNIHDVNEGINFEQSSGSATISGNSFTNISGVVVNSEITDPVLGPPNLTVPSIGGPGPGTGLVTISNNWWGQSTGPSAGQIASDIGATDTVWYTDASKTTLSNNTHTDAVYTSPTDGQADLPSGVTDIVLDNTHELDVSGGVNNVSGGNITVGGVVQDLTNYTGGDLGAGVDLDTAQIVGGQLVTVGKAVTLQSGTNTAPIVLTNTDLNNVSASIPDGTTVLASTGWDGTIAPPKAGSSSGIAPSGFSVGGTVIEVGSPGNILLFDKAVTILLTGVTGPVGYKPAGSDTWTQITTTCGGSYANPASPVFPGECAITDGTNTKILTYHFTSFAGLNAVVVTPAAATPAPKSNTYVVKSGDTMSAIARKFGLTLAQLEALNPQAGHPAGNFSLILPGDVLNVGGAVIVASSTAATTQSPAASSQSENPEVLGTTSDNGVTSSTKTETPSIAAAVASSKATGLKWYWYAAITAAVLAVGAIFYAYRIAGTNKK